MISDTIIIIYNIILKWFHELKLPYFWMEMLAVAAPVASSVRCEL